MGTVGQPHNPPAADVGNAISDKAAQRTATATVWIAALPVVLAFVGILTLIEVIMSGNDTKQPIDAAKKQADAAKSLADEAKVQSDNTAKVAGAASDQVTKLGGLVSATAAQNKILGEQLEATDRPWIKIIGATASHPVIFHSLQGIGVHGKDFINLGIKVIIKNVGRSVALDLGIRANVIFVSVIQGTANDPFTYPVAAQKALCSKPAEGVLPINLFPGKRTETKPGTTTIFRSIKTHSLSRKNHP